MFDYIPFPIFTYTTGMTHFLEIKVFLNYFSPYLQSTATGNVPEFHILTCTIGYYRVEVFKALRIVN